MKKITFFKTLLVAAGLLGGSNAWADTETVGESDLSTGYLGATSTIITVADGGSIHYTFTQARSTTNNWEGWILYAGTVGATVSSGNATIILRGDNWEDKVGANTGCSNNFVWGTNDETFRSDMNGATIDMVVGYSSGLFTMNSNITTTDGNIYYYNYTKTIESDTPSSLDVCLSVNAAYLTITTCDYYAPAGSTMVDATLVHTAAVQGGSNSTGSTLDTETHYINGFGTSGWVAQAYAGFSYTIPSGDYTITDATLSFYSNCSRTGSRTTSVYYKDGTSFDWNNLSLSAASGTSLGKVSEPSTTYSWKNMDVTSAVNAILGSTTSATILFQFGGAAAGGTIYGKGSNDYAPSLSITYTNSATASYTVKYYDTDNNYIKDGSTYSDIPVGTIVTPSSSDQASFTNDDYKYAYSFSGPCIVDGTATNVLKVYCTQEEKIAYSITAMCGDTNLGSLGSGSVYASDATKVFWNKYIQVDGQWYVTTSSYGMTITEAGNTNVEYSTADIYSFIECESTTYNSGGDTNNNTAASNGTAVLLASGKAMATKSKIASGIYDISVYGFVRRANVDQLKLQYSTDNSTWTDMTTLTFASSETSIQTAEKVVLAEDCYIRFLDVVGQNSCHYYDYIVLKESTVSATIGTAGYTSFSSTYPLDLDNISGGTAYMVTSNAENGYITLTEAAGTVAAGTGLILKGNAGTVTIPVAASGTDYSATNKLVAMTTTGDVAAGNYILAANKDGSEAGFYLLDGATSLDAGKAYLPASAVNEAKARFLFSDDATAIKTIAVDAAESAAIYNLSGQRVNATYKGIVIKNGKKYLNK